MATTEDAAPEDTAPDESGATLDAEVNGADVQTLAPGARQYVRRDGTIAVSMGPAHGTRPPFASGNTLAMRTGHRSARVYAPLAKELAAGLLAERPELANYPGELASWAEWEARCQLLRRHLAMVGDIDPATGDVRNGLTKWLRTCEDRAARARHALGLTPFSEASLARERAAASVLAVDLAALAERGRATLAARLAAGELTDDPDPAGRYLAAVAAEGAAATAKAYAAHDDPRAPAPMMKGRHHHADDTDPDPDDPTTPATG